jgi:hypothetical protein
MSGRWLVKSEPDAFSWNQQVANGSTQKFRFLAAQSGSAVITFLHNGQSPSIQDTIIVQ